MYFHFGRLFIWRQKHWESFGLNSESEYVKNEKQSSTRREKTVRSVVFRGKKLLQNV